jgi:hypothetical protein
LPIISDCHCTKTEGPGAPHKAHDPLCLHHLDILLLYYVMLRYVVLRTSGSFSGSFSGSSSSGSYSSGSSWGLQGRPHKTLIGLKKCDWREQSFISRGSPDFSRRAKTKEFSILFFVLETINKYELFELWFLKKLEIRIQPPPADKLRGGWPSVGEFGRVCVCLS